MVTLHPTIVYFNQEDGNVGHKSMGFVSEVLYHNASMVSAIIKKTVESIRTLVPGMKFVYFGQTRGWSGGAKVLGKLPVPGRPTYLDFNRARAYCTCNSCGGGLFGHFFSQLSLLFSFSLSLGDGLI